MIAEDRYLRLAELAHYSSLSVKTLTRAIADETHPLPAHRVGRVVLVRKSDFDQWLDTANTRGEAAAAHARKWVRKLMEDHQP